MGQNFLWKYNISNLHAGHKDINEKYNKTGMFFGDLMDAHFFSRHL